MSSRHLFFRPTTTDVHRDVRKSDAGADMVFMCLDRTRLRTLPTWIPYGFFRPMNNPICIVPYLEIAMFNIDMQKKLFLDDLHLKNSYFQWLFLITIGIQRVLEQENTWKGLERWFRDVLSLDPQICNDHSNRIIIFWDGVRWTSSRCIFDSWFHHCWTKPWFPLVKSSQVGLNHVKSFSFPSCFIHFSLISQIFHHFSSFSHGFRPLRPPCFLLSRSRMDNADVLEDPVGRLVEVGERAQRHREEQERRQERWSQHDMEKWWFS